MYKKFKSAMNDMPSGMDNSENHGNVATKHTAFTRSEGGCEVSPPTKDNAEPRKVFKSSVVLVPPEDVWTQIQAIREKHDSGYIRWMPHVNLVYPFLADTNDGETFQDAADNFTKALSTIQPFTVKFTKDSFCYFIHKKKCTLWLKPIEQNGENTHVSMNQNVVIGSETEQTSREVAVAENSLSDVARGGCSGEDVTGVKTIEGDAADAIDVSDILSTDLADEEAADIGTKTKKKEKLSKAEKKALKKLQQPQAPDPGVRHAEVMKLQSTLESVYSYCNDVSKISERGFMPHLSIGQFNLKEVVNYLEQFRDEWTDMEFTVKEIYLISRDDYEDPFHIRHSVPLGKT